MATRLQTGGGAPVLPFDQLAPILRAIPSLPRPVLAVLTARLIDRLDDLDGDADLEDDERAGEIITAKGADHDFEDEPIEDDRLVGTPEDAEDDDPAGGNIEDEPHDEETDYCLAGDDGCGPARSIAGGYAWGADEDARFLPDHPRYGIDQSLGPLNEAEAYRRHMLAQHQDR